jgi:dihydropyrimidine dehydrogenase (NAD+) subunit PreA
MISGLEQYMDEKGFETIDDFVGMAIPNVTDWQYLNLNHITKAKIDQDLCISCGRCFAACEDTSHQAISMSADRKFEVIDAECVACNLCVNVCPVEGCISMEELVPGQVDARTGETVVAESANWTTHPNNPASLEPAE